MKHSITHLRETRGRLRAASFFLVFGVAGPLAGCSSAPASSSSGSATGSARAVLAAHSFAVASTPSAVAAESVTFATNTEVQSFAVGDVIASGSATAASPYLRTITAVMTDSPTAGSTTFATAPASLDDLFDEADIDQSVAATSGATESVAPLDFAETIGGGKTWTPTSLGQSGIFTLADGSTLDYTESSFQLTGKIDFQYEKKSGLTVAPDHVRLVLDGGVALTLGAKVTTTASVSYTSPTLTYGEVTLGTFVVTAGPVPIPVVVSVAFSASATASLMGSITLHDVATASMQLQAGVDYTSAGGVAGVSSHQEVINHAPFTVSASESGSFRVYPLNAEVKFAVFDAAGPHVDLDPYVGAQGQAEGSASTSGDAATSGTVQGTVGIEGKLGGDLTVLGKKLGSIDDMPLFDEERTFASCSTSALVCNVGPVVQGGG